MDGKRSNRNLAIWTLALATLGFLASFPFQDTFAGGLLTAGFGAAMVGGLADWFAVEALFRRPLGIPWRTAVIPRGRERIFQSIIAMVENELLTGANIGRTLDKYKLTDTLLVYIGEHSGKRELQTLADHFIRDLLQTFHPEEVGNTLAAALERQAADPDSYRVAGQVVRWSVHHGYADRAAAFVAGQLAGFAGTPFMRELLADLISQAKEAYENGNARRRLINDLLAAFAGLSVTVSAAAAQSQLVAYLHGLEDPLHPVRQKLRTRLIRIGEELETSPAAREKAAAWMAVWAGRLPIADRFSAYFEQLRASAALRHPSLWLGRAGDWFGVFTRELRSNEEREAAMDNFAKTRFLRWLDDHHGELGTMIRNRLECFDDRMLADFIESRAGNDLQMIRINGSVVGGLTGITIFLLTYWLEWL